MECYFVLKGNETLSHEITMRNFKFIIRLNKNFKIMHTKILTTQ